MLARAYRLRKSAEFQRLYSRGNRTSTDLFKIFWRPNQYDHSFWAVVVSKKITKKAVERNTMRRRVYELVRKHHKDITGHYNIVILLKTDISKHNPAALEKNLLELFKKARITT